jgi:hypothetical protein
LFKNGFLTIISKKPEIAVLFKKDYAAEKWRSLFEQNTLLSEYKLPSVIVTNSEPIFFYKVYHF